MKTSGRLFLIVLLLGLVLLLGILYRSILVDYLVRPLAILIWYIWRIVSSVDQAVYWVGLVLLGLFYAFYHILLRRIRTLVPADPTPPPVSNATLENVQYWRTTILITQDEIAQPNILTRELGKRLASMIASRQAGASTIEIYNGLKGRQIPLPENVYAFLFPETPAATRRTFSQSLQVFWQAPRNWVRRLTKRDVEEYLQRIEQVVAFMESTMEIDDDAKTIHPSKH